MQESILVTSPRDPYISMEITPGHFATSSTHVSHYLDFTYLKSNSKSAETVAVELAEPYLSEESVDTILCLEGTNVIGTFMAQELLQNGALLFDQESSVNILTPSIAVSGQLILQQNTLKMVQNKNVILLVSTVSSGKIIHRAMDCLSYYGGTLLGISALFAAVPAVSGFEINTVFTAEDIDGYHSYRISDCEMCNNGEKLDAIVNHSGYIML